MAIATTPLFGRGNDLPSRVLFKLLKRDGCTITCIAGGSTSHPYKVTHAQHPGAVLSIGKSRRFAGAALHCLRREFRLTFGRLAAF